MSPTSRARLMMIASMAVFGTLGPFVRYIPLSSGELALARAVMAAGLIGICLLLRGQRPVPGSLRAALPLLFVSGGAIGINWIFLFEAYRYTTVSSATLSYYFAPVLVTLLCPLLFREKTSVRSWLCFAMSTLGIVLITVSGETASGEQHLIGILFGLGAAVFYASVILLNKYIRGIDGIQRTFFQFLAAIIVLIPYICLTERTGIASMDSRGWICLLVIGFVHTGITYCLYFSAIRKLAGRQTAMLSYIDPLVAVIVSITLLHEEMTLVQIIGGALILGFTLLSELPPRKSSERENI